MGHSIPFGKGSLIIFGKGSLKSYLVRGYSNIWFGKGSSFGMGSNCIWQGSISFVTVIQISLVPLILGKV